MVGKPEREERKKKKTRTREEREMKDKKERKRVIGGWRFLGGVETFQAVFQFSTRKGYYGEKNMKREVH